MLRKICSFALILSFTFTGRLCAQLGPNTTRPLTPHKTTGKLVNGYKILLFPDFYHPGITQSGDTSLTYDCYDKDMHKVHVLEINSVDDIDHIEFFMGLTQPQQNQNSAISPPISYKKKFIYVHPEPDSWMRIEPATSKMTKYKLFKNKITKVDTSVMTDPATHEVRKFIFKYYKTELTGNESTAEHHHHH